VSGGGEASLDLAHLRGWIGREERVEDIVTADLARRYAATFEQQGAAGAGTRVPRLIHWCLAQPAVPTAGLGHDGHPARGGFLPPVALPRRMWAGGAVTFHGDLAAGDAVTRLSRIAEVALKDGRSGPLCFVTVEHRMTVGGALKIEERQDIVYRGADTPSGAATASPPPESGAQRRHLQASPALLFRYSALTFNGHRIHYDRPYATQVEGYPGLVVHGPLLATLLCDYAGELSGRPPDHFAFRGMSPLFDHESFTLHAREDAGALRLWITADTGTQGASRLCMSAEASWR
jgi:3-methylfumaryl-CoA hydratase